MLYYTKSARQALKELASHENGLASSDAKERLELHGPNTIKVTGEPLWRKLIEPFANIFMLVLFIATGISLLHHAVLDAVIIGIIIAVSAVIYYVQRFSTEQILRSLQKHVAQTVEVLRDGKPTHLDASELVPGDIVRLREGEKVPADARVISAQSLRADESQLTGESLPVSKQTDALSGEKELYEQSNMLFQGSFIVAGEAMALVVATGNATEFGQLAALASETPEQSPVQKKIDRLVSQIIGVVAGVALVAFALALLRGMELAESLRFVIVLSVSAVPESLPVAISVILVLGMRRMARKKALVRTMRSIETIGVITTIATDKTGTLTKNQLTVRAVWQLGKSPAFTKTLLRATNTERTGSHDPLDTAMERYALEQGVAVSSHAPLRSLPFDQTTAMSGNLWHNGSLYDLAIKGAPEHVLARCDLTEGEHERITVELHQLTGKGYRVLALAHTSLKKPITSFKSLGKKDKLVFDGLIAVADVLRPEAKSAIRAATGAGITVRMVTGDHFETAYHTGRELGMVTTREQVFDCRRLSVMSDEELEKVIERTRVFSRVIPEHKYRILTLLKQHNVTAMTGDGVNDVPALANAHVGVAMGSGASIAKDAGDIILLDDNFKSIIDAMHEGRIVFANIRRMLYYLLSTNTGEVLTLLGSLVIGLPVPLAPVQVLWVNLITDTAMVIPLGLEPGEKSLMKKPPSASSTPILGNLLISRMILVALSMAILTLGLYAFYWNNYGHEYARTVAFAALVVMQWANAFNARSDHGSIFGRLRVFNGKFYIGLTIAVSLQLIALFGPLGPLLHIAPIAIGDLVIVSLIAFATPIILIEIHKYISRRFFAA